MFSNNCIAVKQWAKQAFSLIELLIVISLITMLIGILVPVLSLSRSHGKRIVCSSNIRQLALANNSYANHHDGYYVPAALDTYEEDGNKHRWYGVRDSNTVSFDITRGPLLPYLSQVSLNCPQKVRFQERSPTSYGYDSGNGGYGYNMIYIGSRIWAEGYEDKSCKNTAKVEQVKNPAETLMFADTATIENYQYVEYSFAEPRYFIVNTKPDTTWDPAPSIHFRHHKKATIAWVDAHVTAEKMARYDGFDEDVRAAEQMDIGWFEPTDNTPFDLE